MTSEAREGALAQDDDVRDAGAGTDGAEDVAAPAASADDATEETAAAEAPAGRRGLFRRRRAAAADELADTVDDLEPEDDDTDTDEDDAPPRAERRRASLPLVPVLAILLVLLLAGVGYLWFTRPDPSSVRTGDYVGVLQAARSEVVDLTSFDYLTLDDDIAEMKKITTGDLRDEIVSSFEDRRQALSDSQAVVETEVVDAGVTKADDERGTVLLVIQSTQKTSTDTQAQVVRYRIQADLTKVDGRWLLSGLTGL